MKKIFIIIVLLLLPAAVFAAGWTCRNADMEITCSAQKCEQSSGFTPLSVDVTDRGAISVCAYSGCWKGKGEILGHGSHLLLSAQKLVWSGIQRAGSDFMVALDTNSGIAVINGNGFAMPLLCKERK